MAKKKSGRGGGRGGSKNKKGGGGGKGGGTNGKKSAKKSASLADDSAATDVGTVGAGSTTTSSTTPLTTAPDAKNNANTREAKARDDAETKLISRLYTLSRSLLASLSGCAPDGSPLAEPSHPLAKLHQQLLDQVDVLMKMQSDDSSRSQPWRNMAGGDDEKEKNEEDTKQHRQQRSAGSFTNRASPEAWSAFASWLSECGISPSEKGFPVEIRPSVVAVSSDDDSDDQKEMVEYGLFAKRDIAYGEVVLRLTMETMMCPYFENALEKSTEEEMEVITGTSSLPPPPFDPNRPVAKDMQLRPLCLITHLVNERYRGQASIFAPYLDTLPECTSTPLNWSLEEIRSLKQTAHLKRAVMMQAKLVWDYVQAREMIDQTHKERSKEGGAGTSDATLIPTRDFTFELFRWATVTAHSRQNLIPFPVKNSRRAATVAASPTNNGNEEGGEEADIDVAHGLVPLWDLLNHEDSDRACQTNVIFERIDGDKSRLRAVLVCQTPPDAPKGNPLCFHAGEEVTMHYGKRSNAQLLYHSGFVNCIVETSDTEENGEMRGGEQINRNRSDCALLRIALPPAEDDAGLDRIRERVAARFGFRAYANQGCEHDGIACAKAAATILAGVNASTDKENQTKRPAGARKATEVVMTEFAVSSHDAMPEGLSRALLLCVANKEELTHLLRNMDTYMKLNGDESSEESDECVASNSSLLQLGEKHLKLAEKLVDIQCNRRRKEGVSSGAKVEREKEQLASSLALCDKETLRSWLHVLHVQLLGNGATRM